MNQRYNQLIYDRNKHLYYRVFTHEKISTGKIEASPNWSICVFNESFVKIHEEIFDMEDYNKFYIFTKIIKKSFWSLFVKKIGWSKISNYLFISFFIIVFFPIQNFIPYIKMCDLFVANDVFSVEISGF